MDDNIRLRNEAIYERYQELAKQEREENPDRARWLGLPYYAQIISRDPMCPLSKEYIVKLIRRRLKYGNFRCK